MKSTKIFFSVCLVFGIVAIAGCASPFHRNNDSNASQASTPKWMHIGTGTGVDPRAKAIEKRLGYE